MNPRTESTVIEKHVRAPGDVRKQKANAPPMFDQLLTIAAEHRRALARVIIFSALISAAIAFAIPKRYESVLRVMPP